MSAWSLATGKDDSDIEFGRTWLTAFRELDDRHSVSVREEFLDLGLVADRLGRCTLDHLHRALESLRKLWLVSGASFLKI